MDRVFPPQVVDCRIFILPDRIYFVYLFCRYPYFYCRAIINLREKRNYGAGRGAEKSIASFICRVKKEQAEKFKAYNTDLGKPSNAVLREIVMKYIGESDRDT